MGNFEKEIRLALKRKNMSLATFIELIGFSEQACYKIFRNNSTTVKRITQINALLNINLLLESPIENNESGNYDIKQKSEYGSDTESILERYRNEWNEEKSNLQSRIIILTNTIRDLSLGKKRKTPYCHSSNL